MSKKYPLKSGIFFNYRTYKNGRIVHKYTSPRKMAFYAKATLAWDVERPEKMYLKVNYSKDSLNDGVYETKKDWIFAYKAFTEQSLINYLSV